MQVRWTDRALSDLARLSDFLAVVNRQAAARTVQSLSAAALRLGDNPRLGLPLKEFAPREVRRVVVAGAYEMRYEISPDGIVVLRLWHAREDR